MLESEALNCAMYVDCGFPSFASLLKSSYAKVKIITDSICAVQGLALSGLMLGFATYF